ncbi:tryptophan halogenase family protein [Ideonella paludis]|uniref:Tryptophan 7-halogenase n=1 Tax=Ideonella paludis TaxID=1233411 RepID=A0ABS5DXX7_9BURK|nr:tryptophan halogenase family protein [Ideonella paludis]MBQ0936000.1 tryptophan 7-halogenase [Ideonella paludis]
MSAGVKRLVVVGGGSAGWLVAAILAAAHQAHQARPLSVLLIESAAVPIIGVGEGTWPSMRDTLRAIGLPEDALFTECDAAFKQGSRFDGWVSGAPEDRYHHPFSVPEGFGELDVVTPWATHFPDQAFAEWACPQAVLCNAGRAPKQAQTPQYAAVTNYGYHFDATKFGQVLKRHCLEQLGVRHLIADVQGITRDEQGYILSLQTAQHGEVPGDLFVDCTGMASLLLGQHLGVGLKSQKSVLFNDSAWATQVPYTAPDSPIATQTVATAQAAGWVWDIGLQSRRGVGLVYSSAHCSDAQALATLERYVERSANGVAALTPRKISFEPGYRERFWQHNCVAIGLSSGFIEPLEASALAMVEMAAALLSDTLPASREDMPVVAARFNEAMHYKWGRVIEFLKLHYVLSRRQDEAYWREHREAESIPARLAEQLLLWRARPPSRHDFGRIDEVFPAASYQYILYGMGVKPQGLAAQPLSAEVMHLMRHARHQTERMAAALPTPRELLQHIVRHGQHRI